jgi:hypothetical protein
MGDPNIRPLVQAEERSTGVGVHLIDGPHHFEPIGEEVMIYIRCPHCSKTLLYGVTSISISHPSIQRNKGQPYVVCDSCKRFVRIELAAADAGAASSFEVSAQQEWSPELAKSLVRPS